jgi:hypothetical protein
MKEFRWSIINQYCMIDFHRFINLLLFSKQELKKAQLELDKIKTENKEFKLRVAK